MWGQLLGIGANLAMNAFKGKGSAGEQGPGFTDTGWSQGNKGPIEPYVLEPLTENRGPVTKMEKINNWMGSDIGKATTDVAGGFLSDYRSLRNTKKNFSRLKSEGLTAVQIAGGGGASGAVSSQGNTLGSGPAVQAKSQQAFQADQAERNRKNQRDVALITAQAGRTTAAVTERKDLRAAQLHPAAMRQAALNLKKMKVEIATKKFDLKYKFPIIFARMGPENALFSLAAYDAGLDFEAILTMKPGQNRKAVRDLIDWYNKFKSFVGKETHGVTEFFEWVGKETGLLNEGKHGLQTLGTGDVKKFGKEVINPMKGGLLGAMWRRRK